MHTITVLVDWCGSNYAAYISGGEIGGLVTATARTFDELQRQAAEALRFHVEGCLSDGDTLPDWLVKGDYRLDFEKRFSAILHDAQQYTTLAVLSRETGIRHAQLSHYANAVSQPRPAQRRRIIEGLHAIGRQLAAV